MRRLGVKVEHGQGSRERPPRRHRWGGRLLLARDRRADLPTLVRAGSASLLLSQSHHAVHRFESRVSRPWSMHACGVRVAPRGLDRTIWTLHVVSSAGQVGLRVLEFLISVLHCTVICSAANCVCTDHSCLIFISMGLGRVLHSSIPVRFRYICTIVSIMALAELVRRSSSNSIILRNDRGDVEPTRPRCSDNVGLDAESRLMLRQPGDAPSIDLTHKSAGHSEACIRAGRKLRDVNACSKIVAIGTSITFGSNGAHGENHPDSLRSQKDAWPAVLGTLLPGCQEVINAGESACGPYCHVRRWHERPPSLFNEADVVILELAAYSEHLAPNVAAAYLEAVFPSTLS